MDDPLGPPSSRAMRSRIWCPTKPGQLHTPRRRHRRTWVRRNGGPWRL